VSSPQTVATTNVFDYLKDAANNPLRNQTVSITLQYGGAIAISPPVFILNIEVQVQTDGNGFWQANLVPNGNLTPSGTTYVIEVGGQIQYEIVVPASGPVQSSTIIVNQPLVLSPAPQTITGPITVSGNETVTGTLTVQGTTTLASETITGTSVHGGDATFNGNAFIHGPDPWFDVRQFGAVGNGSTDDTTAIQSAITAAVSNAGGRVYFPPGTYLISSTLTITSDNVELQGAGWSSQILAKNTFATSPMVQSVAPGGGAFRYGIRIADLFINGNSVAGVTGLQLDTTYQAKVDHVRIRFCGATSLFLNGSSGNVGAYTNVTDCTITDGTTASSIGVTTNFHEWVTIKGGLVGTYNVAGGTAIKINNLNCRIIGVGIDNNDTGVWQVFAGRLVVSGCQFDRGQTHFIRLQGAQFCSITGNSFNSFNGSGTKNIIDIDDANTKANIFTGNAVLEAAGWTNWVVENANTGSPGNLYEGNDIGTFGVTLVTGVARANRGFNPATRVSQTVAQSITNVTVTTVTFNNVEKDVNSNYNSGTGTWTAPVPGTYRITARMGIGGTAGNNRSFISVYVNGSERRRGTDNAGTTNGVQNAYVATTEDLAAADAVTIRVFIDVGSNQNTVATTATCYFEVEAI